MRWIICAWIAIALACAPADRGAANTTLTERQFIDLYIALRQARLTAGDSAAFERAKRDLFRTAGTTEAEFERFLTAHQHDLPALARIFDSIQTRLLQIEAAR